MLFRSGGTTEPATQALLTFDVFLPDTIDTGHRHQVKINQISMTMADGTEVTAKTRNGLIGIYKLGDTNGDNSVDALDVLNMVTVSLQKETDAFVEEVSDINEDGVIDAQDVLGVVEIALEK